MMRSIVVKGIATVLAAASLTIGALAQAPSTAFTYQGFLRVQGAPANGTYDLRFTLYNVATAGTPLDDPFVVEDVTINDGLFTVEIDFGLNPFNGQRRWIEIGVRPGDSTGAFSELAPRIELTPVPYALFAHKVADSAIGANQLANDANALSKVSGGNLSITPDGYLKQNKIVYVRAVTPRDVSGGGCVDPPNCTFWALTPFNSGEYQWFGIRFANVVRTVGGGYNPTTGEFTAPVAGFYFVSACVQHFTQNQSNQNGYTATAIQILETDGKWVIVGYSSNTSVIGAAQTISAPVYLRQGQKLRVGVAVGTGWRAVCTYNQGYLTIYLLSAADLN